MPRGHTNCARYSTHRNDLISKVVRYEIAPRCKPRPAYIIFNESTIPRIKKILEEQFKVKNLPSGRDIVGGELFDLGKLRRKSRIIQGVEQGYRALRVRRRIFLIYR